jgi:hypothetical protein
MHAPLRKSKVDPGTFSQLFGNFSLDRLVLHDSNLQNRLGFTAPGLANTEYVLADEPDEVGRN